METLGGGPEADDAEEGQSEWRLAFAASDYGKRDLVIAGVRAGSRQLIHPAGVGFFNDLAGLVAELVVEQQPLGAVDALSEEVTESRRAATLLDVDQAAVGGEESQTSILSCPDSKTNFLSRQRPPMDFAAFRL